MRGCGVEEKYITGDASDYEKFMKWAEALPYCIGNPLYHWTHLELQRYFGIYETLSPKTADMIWEKCNEQIKAGGFTPRSLIEKSNVVCVCTTDDAADSLEYHKLLAEDKSFKCKVLPAFRPDKSFLIDSPVFKEWVVAMEKAAKMMSDLRASIPESIGGAKVTSVRDYRTRVSTDLCTGEKTSIQLPVSNVLELILGQSGSVIVRPSGTEPKVKFYYTAVGQTKEASQELLEKMVKQMSM
jgi:hypothetical protein